MKITFAYGKVIRPNQSTWSPITPITSVIESKELSYHPYGDSVVNTAPSTLFTNNTTKAQYILAKPFSAVYSALTAITTTDGSVSLL